VLHYITGTNTPAYWAHFLSYLEYDMLRIRL